MIYSGYEFEFPNGAVYRVLYYNDAVGRAWFCENLSTGEVHSLYEQTIRDCYVHTPGA